MSATTEALLEQIERTQKQITEVEATGADVSDLHLSLKTLREQLSVATSALNEGKQVLKG